MKHTKLTWICIAFCTACLLSGCTVPIEPETADFEIQLQTTSTEEVTTAAQTRPAVTARTEAQTTAAEQTTQPPAETEAPAPKSYSDDQLRELAINYYGARTNHLPEFCNISTETDGTVSIQLYDVIQNHTATCDWYYVNRMDASGKNLLEEPVTLTDAPPELWNPQVTLRTLLFSEEFCGVVYLGKIDRSTAGENPASTVYQEMLMQTGYADQCPWFFSLPESNYIRTDGAEAYLIIPHDNSAKVTVTWNDPVTNAVYGRIYSSYNGSPFLLVCNRSETASDVLIRITDQDGTHPAFSLSLSGEDGRPAADQEGVRILN